MAVILAAAVFGACVDAEDRTSFSWGDLGQVWLIVFPGEGFQSTMSNGALAVLEPVPTLLLAAVGAGFLLACLGILLST